MFADNFRKMAEVLKVTPADLQRRIAPNTVGNIEESKSLCGVSGPCRELAEVPGYHSISAGVRSERLAVEVGGVKVPQGLCDFCVRVDGESMMPTYPNAAMASCWMSKSLFPSARIHRLGWLKLTPLNLSGSHDCPA
jgi:hypothetical protein